MPAVRLSRRRRSSHALFTPAKPGIYGVPARPVTFAPNVTPITYNEVDPEDDPSNPFASLALSASAADPNAPGLTSKLFPPSETPAPPPTRKRCPPGKRRSQGYIPRPPNAFMLFRADFVRQKHVPGSIETNHGSLSKIIGTCWRQLPLEEKRVWEVKAKQEKAAHKAMFPDYRFRPVHNKNKHLKDGNSNVASDEKRKEKPPTTAEDERRCDEVAQLLLEGKKGEELARAVRNLDRARSMERERELDFDGDDYELGLEGGESRRPSFEFDSSPGSAGPSNGLHMPVSQHAFAHPYPGHHVQMPYHRRSSSVPLPNEWLAYTSAPGGIALPAIPQFMSRPASPVGSIARFNQIFPQHQQQQDHFTNPFQQQNFNTEYQFAPIPEFTPTFGSQSQQQQPGLFHPSPQHAFMNMNMQTSPRSSLGLGLYRRASSAQPMLMRSWTMPTYEYPMSMPIPIERDPSPLPDVDPELFGNFSFGKSSSSSSSSTTTMPSERSAAVHSSSPQVQVQVSGEQVNPSSSSSSPLVHDDAIPPTSLALAHIDTSVTAPELSMHSSSSSSSSTSTSSSGSPATSVVDLSHMPLNAAFAPPNTAGNAGSSDTTDGTGTGSLDMSAYIHLDGLYAPDPMGMGMGMYVADHHDAVHHHHHQQVYAPEQYVLGMGMYTYDVDVDPVVSSTQGQGQASHEASAYMHEQQKIPQAVGPGAGYEEAFFGVSA